MEQMQEHPDRMADRLDRLTDDSAWASQPTPADSATVAAEVGAGKAANKALKTAAKTEQKAG